MARSSSARSLFRRATSPRIEVRSRSESEQNKAASPSASRAKRVGPPSQESMYTSPDHSGVASVIGLEVPRRSTKACRTPAQVTPPPWQLFAANAALVDAELSPTVTSKQRGAPATGAEFVSLVGAVPLVGAASRCGAAALLGSAAGRPQAMKSADAKVNRTVSPDPNRGLMRGRAATDMLVRTGYKPLPRPETTKPLRDLSQGPRHPPTEKPSFRWAFVAEAKGFEPDGPNRAWVETADISAAPSRQVGGSTVPARAQPFPSAVCSRVCSLPASTRHKRLRGPVLRLGTPISELHSLSGRRDSNPRRQPWQGCTLPLSYSRTFLRTVLPLRGTTAGARGPRSEGA